MKTAGRKNSSKTDSGGFSLDRILLEITNFGVLEAETEASWKKFLNKVDYGNKKSKTMEQIKEEKNVTQPESESGSNNSNYRNLLVNDNIVIIDKTPSKIRQTKIERHSAFNNQSTVNVKPGPKKSMSKNEMPQPNTVRHFKDIFETMSFERKQKAVQTRPKTMNAVGRSLSVRVTNSDWQQTNPSASNRKINQLPELNLENAALNNRHQKTNSLPPRLELINEPSHKSEYEERRDWLSACSPISPEVIQKLREHGTSMTFFGRRAYSVTSSPVMNESRSFNNSDWLKPRVIGTMPKYMNRSSPSLGSSSSCSEDESQYMWENDNIHNSDVFGDGYYYYSILNLTEDKDDRDSGHEDFFSYDIVYLNENYSRSSTPKMGPLNKGMWLKDPYWHGSSYIIYDFRGTDVKPQIDNRPKNGTKIGN